MEDKGCGAVGLENFKAEAEEGNKTTRPALEVSVPSGRSPEGAGMACVPPLI